MGRPSSPQSTPGSVGLSGSRLLYPHEYQLSRLGIHTKWTARVEEKPVSRLRVFPSPRDWWRAVLDFRERTPLLLRFSRELAAENGRSFWVLLGLNICQACIPSSELYFSGRLIEIAHVVGSGGLLNSHLFAFAFVGRVATTLVSITVDRLCTLYEEKLNSRFSLTIQAEILKIHCLLDDDELELPETRRKLGLLRELGGSSVYRRIFDPLGFLSVGNSALSVGLGAAMLASQLTPTNGFFLALSLGFMALEELDAWYGERPPVEHFDITNDAFLRFQNMFRLGTSKSLRREVTILGIQNHILSSALTAKSALGTTATTLGSCTFQQHQPPLRLTHLILQLSRPITTSLFILHTALVAPHSASPLVSFAEMAVLESAAWNLRVRWASLRRGVRELRGGMESLEAMYECEKLEMRREKKEVAEYVRRVRKDEEGRELRGMEIEFRNVTLRYSPSSLPALDNVSFKILPGQLVSIVGHNGSGKTSLVSLLSLSQKLTSGEILINSINVLDYSRRDLARVMSFTFQTSPVLPMSIKEYVSLGSPSHALSDDSLVLHALKASAANAVVDQLGDGWLSYAGGTVGATLSPTEWQLPQLVPRPPGVPSLEMLEMEGGAAGLEASMSSEGTLVDGEKEEGEPKKRQAQMRVTSLPTLVNGEEATIHFPDHSPEPCVLSGGQWQRIALARSLCSNENDLLVWDEPAAALDPIAEASLFDQILSLRGQSTVLFTTHRFGICTRADLVLMFKEGKLVEQGTHEELLSIEEGEYRRLWEVQAKGFV